MEQSSLYFRLDLQERDRQCQSSDALHDLVDLTGSCLWRLLPPFSGREILDVFVLLYLSFGTGFRSGVPFTLVTLFGVFRIGIFAPP